MLPCRGDVFAMPTYASCLRVRVEFMPHRARSSHYSAIADEPGMPRCSADIADIESLSLSGHFPRHAAIYAHDYHASVYRLSDAMITRLPLFHFYDTTATRP